MVILVSLNVFLQAVTLTGNDVWNDDGQGAERTKTMLDAICDLPSATTTEHAHELYWRIDNVAVVQGSLAPAGPKILPALLEGLFMATSVSRPYLLEAIYQIISGGPDHRLSIHERERIQGEMVRVAEGAIRYFMDLTVHGSDEEALYAIDLISWIVTAPQRLRITMMDYEPDVRVLLNALKARHPERFEELTHLGRPLFS